MLTLVNLFCVLFTALPGGAFAETPVTFRIIYKMRLAAPVLTINLYEICPSVKLGLEFIYLYIYVLISAWLNVIYWLALSFIEPRLLKLI